MFFSFIMSYREMLEAALIIGSLYLYLHQMKKNSQIVYLYVGAAVGLICNIFLIFFSLELTQRLTEGTKNIIQGFSLILVSIILMILLTTANKHEEHDRPYINKKIFGLEKTIGVLLLSFAIEFKEGIELSILNFANLNKNPTSVLIATLLGMILAILSVYLIFIKAGRISEKRIFKFIGAFLIITTGFMLCQGVFIFMPRQLGFIKPYSEIIVILICLLIYHKGNYSAEKNNLS